MTDSPNRPSKASPTQMVIVVGSDDRYAIGLAVTLYSTLVNLARIESTKVIVVDGGISPESKVRLERVAQKSGSTTDLEWHEADTALFDGLKTSKWGSTANYLRLLIPEIVGESVHRVMYLDSDLMVRGDLGGLWEAPWSSDEEPLEAVGDFHHREIHSVFGEEACQRLNIDPHTPYFNSGVLMINVARWRTENIPSKAIEFVRLHSDVMRHSDQDALNAILRGQWRALNDSWNVMLPSLERFLSLTVDDERERAARRAELLDQGAVFHFTGPKKPWKPGYWGPGGSQYRRLLAASGWFESRSEEFNWRIGYWARSPLAWLRLGYRRLRKRAAIRYRDFRSK